MRNATRGGAEGGPLSDLRVLELGTLIAGPFAGRMFAEFGAEVVKVEHPDRGDPLRSWGMTWDGTDSLWHLIQSRGKLLRHRRSEQRGGSGIRAAVGGRE